MLQEDVHLISESRLRECSLSDIMYTNECYIEARERKGVAETLLVTYILLQGKSIRCGSVSFGNAEFVRSRSVIHSCV